MNTIERIEKSFSLLKNDRVRDILFLAGMSILVFIETMKTTLFPESLSFYAVIKTIALALIILKMVLFDEWKVWSVFFFGLSFAVALLVRYASGYYTEPFFWLLLLWGARDIDFRKILKVHSAVVFLILTAAFVSALAGWVPNLMFYSSYGIRNSFGIGYPTDFAAYVFFLMAAFSYLMKDRMKWWMHSVCILLGIVIFRYCHTRLDSGCLAGLGLLLMITGLVEPHLRGRANVLRWILCFSSIALFAVVFALSYKYDSSVDWMRKLNDLFSHRLMLGHEAFERYNLNLFGQYVEMHGYGGSPDGVADYYFLDSSYMYILFQFGIVFTLIVLVVFVLSSVKERDDLFFLVIMLLIAVNASTAHHLTHIQYNPFFMALFASFKDIPSQRDRTGKAVE